MWVKFFGTAAQAGFHSARPLFLKAANKRLEKARRLCERGEADRSIRLCEKLHASLPPNDHYFTYVSLKGLHHLGCSLLLKGCFEAAAARFEHALTLMNAAPSDKTHVLAASCLLNIAHCRREQGRLDEELALNKEVMTRFERAEDETLSVCVCRALNNKITALTHLGRYSEALDLCQTLIARVNHKEDEELRRFLVSAYYAQGALLVKMGRAADALAPFQAAMDVGSSANDAALLEQAFYAFHKKCAALEFLGQEDEASRHGAPFKKRFSEIAQTDVGSKLLGVFESKGALHFHHGRYEEALAAYSGAEMLLDQDADSQQSPRCATVLFYRAMCFDQLGESGKAHGAHRKLEAAHKHAQALEIRLLVAKSLDRDGVRFLLANRHDYAIKTFRRLAAGFIAETSEEISEIVARAMIKLALALAAIGQDDEALKTNRALIARFDGSDNPGRQLIVVKAIHQQGRCLHRLGRFQEALAAFDEELARCRQSPARELNERAGRAGFARAKTQRAAFERQMQSADHSSIAA